MDDESVGQQRRNGQDKSCKMTKKKWTPKEDAFLIAALSELCDSGWKRENGMFRSGYTAALERKLKSKLPGSNIKASPHIESRLKLLKRQYDAITEMQGADGMWWDHHENMLICENDDTWEDWVQIHADANGLRNKQFPYYDDLHFLFGNRGMRKGIDSGLDVHKVLDDEDNNAASLMVDEIVEEDNRESYEVFQNGSFDEEVDLKASDDIVTTAGADSLIEHYRKQKSQRNMIRNAQNFSVFPDNNPASVQAEDSTGTERSNDENLLADAIFNRTEMQPNASAMKVKNNNSSSSCDNGSSELGELAKIFGTFLHKYQEHLSLLAEILGREATAAKLAGKKRSRLNGELMKLPNLNLQARLRAASLIVTDPAKLDLFYSLSREERREWVSMLLTGLI